MSRYVIKFSKEGDIRYISHLDLLRLFKRCFKRVGIRLQHTQGFNPHPKMSFAQPLSLGYSSSGEYLEFETSEPYPEDEILTKINSAMPQGIAAFSCNELPHEGKALAALTEQAGFEIAIPSGLGFRGNLNDEIEKFISREQIIVLKHQKKSGKDMEIDIRPMIRELSGYIDNIYVMLTAILAAGSNSNLSPELLLSTFCEFAGIQYDRAEVLIRRTEIYFRSD